MKEKETSTEAQAMVKAIQLYVEHLIAKLNGPAGEEALGAFEAVGKKLMLLTIQKYVVKVCYQTIEERVLDEVDKLSTSVN